MLCLGQVSSVPLKIRGVVMVTDNVESALLLGALTLLIVSHFSQPFFLRL